MKAEKNRGVYYKRSHPSRRPLKIFASDPMLAREPGNRISIDIPNEPVQPGPKGARFEVIDFDGANDCFYMPVDLDDKDILMQGGLEPSESDPRFHQQMVYAVAMRTLDNFDKALGRRLEFRKTRLRLLPHAFHGANAFYDHDLNAILFGYFRADRKDPGPNLPGQTVFTCLSHDIIVHEMTHALVDRLRPLFLEPTNEDVLAFHEGFSDIVAILQHFSFGEFLRDEIQKTRANLREGKRLVELASQFGYATGANRALRSAILETGVRLSSHIIEPHERGAILVAAVFSAFLDAYKRQIQDLIRIATGGTGQLAMGDLHPDLVNRVAHEAAKTAQGFLTMCIRAFDYLPPVDITFGDYLRALVTADYELMPGDDYGLRSRMIEAFRSYGIYPENVFSLAEESLIWPSAPEGLDRLPMDNLQIASQIARAATAFSFDPFRKIESESNWGSYYVGAEEDIETMSTDLASELHRYATEHASELQLDPNRKIKVQGFHPVFRVAPNGQLLSELVIQYSQLDREKQKDLGGIPFRGGTTIIAGADGRVRYIIAKPITSGDENDPERRENKTRFDRQAKYLRLMDMRDARMSYADEAYMVRRMKLRMKFRSLHLGL